MIDSNIGRLDFLLVVSATHRRDWFEAGVEPLSGGLVGGFGVKAIVGTQVPSPSLRQLVRASREAVCTII